MDSNHDKQIQNLLCYRYTTRQWEKSAGYNDLPVVRIQVFASRLPSG